MIPYGAHSIDQDDIDGVVEVLKNEFITQGERVPIFEKNLANYVGAEYAVAVNSATSALHISYLALGLGPGDLLWTTPISFVATSNAALMCNANVDFVDVDSTTGLLDLNALELKLSQSKKIPKIVVPVHLTGQSCDMKKLYQLSLEYDFKIVEDASHALGALYDSNKVGCCQYSDACVFSFHPVKMITTGEGGLITTNQKDIESRLKLLRSHGVQKRTINEGVNRGEQWVYEQIELGFNYRMSDIHAALGITQLLKLDGFLDTRRNIALKYMDAFESKSLGCLPKEFVETSSWHLFPIFVDKNDRKELFNSLREENIAVNVHYIPINSQPFYRSKGFDPLETPGAIEYYQSEISIPIFPALDPTVQDKIIAAIKSSL